MKKIAVLALVAILGACTGKEDPEPIVDPAPVVDPDPEKDPDEEKDEPTPPAVVFFSGGDGTGADPFKISTVADLKAMADSIKTGAGTYASACYIQTADISNAALIDHIGTSAKPFKGIYDGNGKKISGISFSAPTVENGHGLFGTVSGGALIKDLIIDGFSSTLAKDCQGAFVGILSGATVDGCRLEGSKLTFSASQVGGIVGNAANGAIVSGCSVSASIESSGNTVAGVVGNATLNAAGLSVLIDKCSFTGDITGEYNIGGILAYATATSGKGIKVINCVSHDCRLTAKSYPSNYYVRIGGILAGVDKASTANVDVFNSCSFNLKLSSTKSAEKTYALAGILGSHYGSSGTIACCWSNILDTDMSYVGNLLYWKGGIVGYKTGKLTLSASDYYDSSSKYAACHKTTDPVSTPCTGISKAQFTDGTLLNALNSAAPSIEGACKWVADSSGYPVPSDIAAGSGSNGEPRTEIRILAIGNSFSVDAVEQYLYEIFSEKGYEAIIGNAYIASCTLQKHWECESSTNSTTKNSNSYRKITKGTKQTIASQSIESMLKDEPWDYVFFQQGDGLYGIESSHHPYIENLTAYVAKYLDSGSYKTGYQMTWAFPKNCTNARFSNYDNDQDKMYRACADCAKSLKDKGYVDIIIPTGTAIQNGRTTSLGDTFNRDWGHLDYNHGRYTASLTWFETLTGIDATTVSWKPVSVTAEQAALCRKAVHDAVQHPYEVTKQN